MWLFSMILQYKVHLVVGHSARSFCVVFSVILGLQTYGFFLHLKESHIGYIFANTFPEGMISVFLFFGRTESYSCVVADFQFFESFKLSTIYSDHI